MQDSTDKKSPEPRVQQTRTGVLQSDAPNVVTLVRVCGNAFAVRRRGGGVEVRPLPRPAPKPAPRVAQVVQLGRPAHE